MVRTFNTWFAEKITRTVGTMVCAYVFAAITLISLPAAIHSGNPTIIIAWFSSNFCQLVLLSIIMVGQSLESAKTEARDTETHDAVMAEHAETREILDDVRRLVAEIHPAVVPGAKP